MIPRLITPPGYIGDEFRRDRTAVWKLYSPLAGLVFFQAFGKFQDSLRARIQPYMVFKTGEMDDIMLLPVSRHTP